jgi:hypothetical protein
MYGEEGGGGGSTPYSPRRVGEWWGQQIVEDAGRRRPSSKVGERKPVLERKKGTHLTLQYACITHPLVLNLAVQAISIGGSYAHKTGDRLTRHLVSFSYEPRGYAIRYYLGAAFTSCLPLILSFPLLYPLLLLLLFLLLQSNPLNPLPPLCPLKKAWI